MRTRSVVLWIIVILALGFSVAVLIDSITPNSTSGVRVVDANTVRLPHNETFVLTHRVGKTTDTWKITYVDNAVYFSCDDWFCSDLDTTELCGVDCKIKVDGGFLAGDFYVWLGADDVAYVNWPWGWTYRPFRS